MSKIFNGTWTIKSEKTGDHRTFKIHTKKEDAKFAPGSRIVALLRGSCNETDYQGFGFVNETNIYVWKNKQTSKLFMTYSNMIVSLFLQGENSPWYAKGYRLMGERHCRRCNRKLTVPESIEKGIGPECEGRL